MLEDGLELNEKLYEVHSHAQATMGKEQRRQRDYFKKKSMAIHLKQVT